MRHGYSVGNEQGLCTGYYDCELNETGRRQAALLCRYLVENERLDRIYSSDLVRAVQTVAPAAEALSLPIVKESALREMNAGRWEGISFDEVKVRYAEEYAAWHEKQSGARPLNGESWDELLARAGAWMDKTVQKEEGHTILLATHGGVIKALECHFLGKPLAYMNEIDWVSNASVSEVHYEGGVYTIIRRSYDDFLSGLQTALPQTI